ncbi:hypothetical protein SRHO_G00189550 [Serrasalmus rhombeus]
MEISQTFPEYCSGLYTPETNNHEKHLEFLQDIRLHPAFLTVKPGLKALWSGEAVRKQQEDSFPLRLVLIIFLLLAALITDASSGPDAHTKRHSEDDAGMMTRRRIKLLGANGNLAALTFSRIGDAGNEPWESVFCDRRLINKPPWITEQRALWENLSVPMPACSWSIKRLGPFMLTSRVINVRDSRAG